MKRRNFLAALGAAFVGGCSEIGDSRWFGKVVAEATSWHRRLHRTLGVRRIEMAPEYELADISPFVRGNGTTEIPRLEYRASLANDFVDWQLAVGGLVRNELLLSLDQVRSLPQRTQVTRHDCVEGWSAIGQWTGPQLSTILALAGVREEARFILFHCADILNGDPYYESCDLDDAYHPQTIIAHKLNGDPLLERNGAPLRLRLERQLGYKHAKYLTGIEAVASLEPYYGGEGGYWEDRGYQWYAGI